VARVHRRDRGEVEPELAPVRMDQAAMTGAGDDERRVVVLRRATPHRVVASRHRFQTDFVGGSRRPVDEVDIPECAAQDRLDAPVRISVEIFDVDEKISAVDVAHEPGEHRGEIGMRVRDHVYPLSGDGVRLICSLGHALTISAAVDRAQSPKRERLSTSLAIIRRRRTGKRGRCAVPLHDALNDIGATLSPPVEATATEHGSAYVRQLGGTGKDL